jgi:hypothetical protein
MRYALASSKKTTATPTRVFRRYDFGRRLGFNVTRASKEEAKKIFDLFAREGALFRLSPIVVPLVREAL